MSVQLTGRAAKTWLCHYLLFASSASAWSPPVCKCPSAIQAVLAALQLQAAVKLLAAQDTSPWHAAAYLRGARFAGLGPSSPASCGAALLPLLGSRAGTAAAHTWPLSVPVTGLGDQAWWTLWVEQTTAARTLHTTGQPPGKQLEVQGGNLDMAVHAAVGELASFTLDQCSAGQSAARQLTRLRRRRSASWLVQLVLGQRGQHDQTLCALTLLRRVLYRLHSKYLSGTARYGQLWLGAKHSVSSAQILPRRTKDQQCRCKQCQTCCVRKQGSAPGAGGWGCSQSQSPRQRPWARCACACRGQCRWGCPPCRRSAAAGHPPSLAT